MPLSHKLYTATFVACVATVGFYVGAAIADIKERRDQSRVWCDAGDTAMGPIHDDYFERVGHFPPSEATSLNGLAQPDRVTDDANSGD